MTIRHLRSDAAARREDILDAAEEVFAREGPQASLALICEGAGVGRATLYRNFPSREAIVEAIFQRNMARLEESGRVLAGDPQALFTLLDHVVDIQIKTGAIYSFRIARGDYDLALRERFRLVVATCLEAAKAAGHVSEAVTVETIQLAIAMLAGGLRDRSYEERLRIKADLLALCLWGLCAEPPAS